VGRGFFRTATVANPVPYTYTDFNPNAQCCCGAIPAQAMVLYERTIIRCLLGPCAGALYSINEVWTTYDGPTNTLTAINKVRSYNGPPGDCCGPEAVFNETTIYNPPFGFCAQAVFGGYGFGLIVTSTWGPWVPLGGLPTGIALNVSGSFAHFCNVTETTLSYLLEFGAQPGFSVDVYRRGYMLPGSEPCLSVECLKTCCLPGGRCLEITEAQCLAIGGLPQDNHYCFEARCDDNPLKGACCNPITGGCTLSTNEGCIPPNTFLGIGTKCAALSGQGVGTGNPCPQPIGRCCTPTGNGGYTCLGLVTPAQCASLGAGSIWGGAGSTCESLPCPTNGAGACCMGDGSCIQVNGAQTCLNQGGNFMGVGTDCQTIPGCTGACCFLSTGGDWTCSEGYSPNQCASANPPNNIFRGQGSTCPLFNPPPLPPYTPFCKGMGGRPASPSFSSAGLVLPDGTPASTIGNLRGCSGCGGAKGEAV